MNSNNLATHLAEAPAPSASRMLDSPEGFLFSWGTSDPTDQGYAPGCVHVDTSAAVVKRNTGTVAAAVWSAITGSSSGLDQTGTWEAGTNDLSWSVISQTSAGTIRIPDLNLAAGTTDLVFTTAAQVLTNKVLTAPQINDTSADHQYIFAVNELTADRTVTLPLLGANATFAFVNFAQTWSAAQTFNYDTLFLNDNNDSHALAINWEENDTSARTLDFLVNAGNRIINLSGDLVLGGDLTTTTGAITLVGQAGGSNVVVPTGGANWEAIAILNTSVAQGDVIVRGAANWQRLAVGSSGEVLTTDGTNVSWGSITSANASNLLDGCTLQDAGAFDAVLSFTQQTTSAPTLTVPDFGGSNVTFAFINFAQTWAAAQTFGYGMFLINDNNDTHALTINWEENDTSARALDFKVNAGDRIIDLSGNLVLGANLTTNTGAITLSPPAGGATVTLVGDLTTTGGAHNLILTLGAATNVTLPASGTVATLGGTETFSGAKTFEYDTLFLNDSNDTHALAINWEENDTGARTLDFKVNAGNRIIDLTGNLVLGANLTTNTGAITLSPPAGGATVTLVGDFTTTGGAHNLILTLGAATNVTLPNTGTLATVAGAETFTNKSYDCDGAGNALTNVNGDEMDPVTTPVTESMVTSIPIILWCHISDEGGDVKMTDSCPYKLIVINAWSVATSADGGTWLLKDNATNAITDTVTVAGVDNDVDRITSLQDGRWTIDAGEDLYVNGSANLDAYIFVMAVRID